MTYKENSLKRQVILEKMLAIRNEGKENLLSTGPSIDEVLCGELSSPGSDMRYGVAFISRPSPVVIDYIISIQDLLRKLEPDQYYYPPSDLHLTILEVVHNRDPEESSSIAQHIQARIDGIIPKGKDPILDSPILVFDAAGCALGLLPFDDTLQEVRANIRERLLSINISVAPRYAAETAHISFMRYTSPLKSDLDYWMSTLSSIRFPSQLTLRLSAVWLTWGANWYGMQSRIRQAGPYPFDGV
jgi:hypothetical protein